MLNAQAAIEGFYDDDAFDFADEPEPPTGPLPPILTGTPEPKAGATALEWALWYARRAFKPLPIEHGTKAPWLTGWTQLGEAAPDTIRGWFNDRPKSGVGLATGWHTLHGRSVCLVVIDVDVSDGKRGEETLADLVAEHGDLPDTVEAITGSGGRHLWYWTDVEIRNDQGGRLGPGLDVRGVGGQVVVEPSIHPTTGRPYSWEHGHSPDVHHIARMPDWLLRILTEAPASEPRERPAAPYDGPQRPGDELAAKVTWRELLEGDGATYTGTRTDRRTGTTYELWTRPGKHPGEGASASLYYGGTDCLHVFSSNWPGLPEGATVNRFAYYAATRHGGDYRAAAAEIAERYGLHINPADLVGSPAGDDRQSNERNQGGQPDPGFAEPFLVDWPAFWADEHAGEDWLIEPVIPRRRSVALFARAKVGKSLLLLDMVAAAATGRPMLGGEPVPPVTCLYLDYEMTASDLRERLEDLGYGPDDDLSRLNYALLPSLPPLDTAAGAAELVKLVQAVGADLVVIDTTGRAVDGPEDKADTIRAFYKHTGSALKRLGVTVLRSDHAGKDREQGQRGSSAKDDDVDLVWELTATQHGVELKRHRSRINWALDKLTLARETEPFLAHRRTDARSWSAGTKAVADRLDACGAPVEITVRTATGLLRNKDGKAPRKAVVTDAVRYRKERHRVTAEDLA